MRVMERSPFPGMDPYLEAAWEDVHSTLLSFLKESLQVLLPPELRARSEERLLVEDDDADPRPVRPDVAVTRRILAEEDEGASGVAVAVAPPATRIEPVPVRLFDPPLYDRWLQVVDRTNGYRVVSVVEVLSPWNKFPGRANDEYRRKVSNFIMGGVNVVEIDLLRLTRDELLLPEFYIPAERREAYYTSVSRVYGQSDWDAYPMSLRRPLPPIPVPLRKKDAEVWVELQPLIDRVYTAGGYDDTDYAKPARPPLRGGDAAWADELLKAAGKR